jgi:glycosyltransferase involved in cell wall biosynthesis
MACACPVIASENTGARDLYTDGLEGFIVPIRDVAALSDRMQMLADQPGLQRAMAQRALQRVQGVGGWGAYGDSAMAIFNRVAGHG